MRLASSCIVAILHWQDGLRPLSYPWCATKSSKTKMMIGISARAK